MKNWASKKKNLTKQPLSVPPIAVDKSDYYPSSPVIIDQDSTDIILVVTKNVEMIVPQKSSFVLGSMSCDDPSMSTTIPKPFVPLTNKGQSSSGIKK